MGLSDMMDNVNGLPFYKYQGAGNDFVMIDNRDGVFSPWNSQSMIAQLCDRHFGIGADGLILLEQADGYDFSMDYYNSDGRRSTMCGNGGRCVVAFARDLGLIADKTHFIAIDGPHDATVLPDGQVKLGMTEVLGITQLEMGYFANTGSPHLVIPVTDVNAVDVQKLGAYWRNHEQFQHHNGLNVNFVQWQGAASGHDSLAPQVLIRTFERGVEGETLACGTGAVAAAVVYLATQQEHGPVTLQTRGGQLVVEATLPEHYQTSPMAGKHYQEVSLTGPAHFVFKGSWPAGK